MHLLLMKQWMFSAFFHFSYQVAYAWITISTRSEVLCFRDYGAWMKWHVVAVLHQCQLQRRWTALLRTLNQLCAPRTNDGSGNTVHQWMMKTVQTCWSSQPVQLLDQLQRADICVHVTAQHLSKQRNGTFHQKSMMKTKMVIMNRRPSADLNIGKIGGVEWKLCWNLAWHLLVCRSCLELCVMVQLFSCVANILCIQRVPSQVIYKVLLSKCD